MISLALKLSFLFYFFIERIVVKLEFLINIEIIKKKKGDNNNDFFLRVIVYHKTVNKKAYSKVLNSYL